jgi:hypothetical protein
MPDGADWVPDPDSSHNRGAFEIFRRREQVNSFPPFARAAKGGTPARAKTELRSNMIGGSGVNCGEHGYKPENALQRILTRTYVVGVPPVVEFLEGITVFIRIPVGLLFPSFLMKHAGIESEGVSRSVCSTMKIAAGVPSV